MPKLSLVAVVFALLATLIGPFQPAGATTPDYLVAGGHFYAQANGQGGAGDAGYVISDGDGIPFWREFQKLGGVDILGYPISHRFEWRGTIVQGLQKAVLQWQPEGQKVQFVNVFDELAVAGKNDWLRSVRETPFQKPVENESALSWQEIVRARQAFLDPYPAIKVRYFSVPDPLHIYGLPSSQVEDVGSAYVVRLQRAVMQQWKVDTAWAKAGQVTVANGGDIAKEAGVFPSDAATPKAVPVQQDKLMQGLIPARGKKVVALDPGHGGAEIGSAHRFADGYQLLEKNVNLDVALKAAAFLRSAGYEVVLTRTTDAAVNKDRRDLNNSGSLSVSDDLQARVDIANAAGAAVFVSVHHNGIANSAVRGTEVYYNANRPFTAQSQRLAQLVQGNLLQSLRNAGYQSVDRQVKTDSSILRGRHFFLLGPKSGLVARPSEMPGALGEALFLTNPADAAQLRRSETIEALAQGYAVAISQFLNEVK